MLKLLVAVVLLSASIDAHSRAQKQTTIKMTDKAKPGNRSQGDVGVFMNVALLGLGVGVSYYPLHDTSIEVSGGFETFVMFGYQYKFIRVRQYFGNSFNVHAGAGSLGEVWSPALTIGLGNEWSWNNGFHLGVDWLSWTHGDYLSLPIVARLKLGAKF